MSSLVNLIRTGGPIKRGDPDGADVLALQVALTAAGYRVATDSVFGPRTDMVVRQFQRQHGLKADGIVGEKTAALLDRPHPDLVKGAKPLQTSGWPHDDTASLLAFYGAPWADDNLLTRVDVPFSMTYEGKVVRKVRIHRRCADALTTAFDLIAKAARSKPSVLRHVSIFSGTYNNRPVRGSSRKSTHAFGAAIDFDAPNLPLGIRGVTSADMPQEVVDAFKETGAVWGGDFVGRKDPMHFQYANP